MHVKIWQLYYDLATKMECEEGYIPKMNTEPDYNKNPYAENLTILDIYFNENWQNADYVGCVSWKYRQKTGVWYKHIIEQIDPEIKIYSLSPQIFNDWPHTFLRENINDPRMENISGMNDIITSIDEQGILPIKMYGKNFVNSFCNYWLMTPGCFNEYMEQYLMPCFLYFESSGSRLLRHQTKHGQSHLKSVLFFLEGLFSVYLYDKKFKRI